MTSESGWERELQERLEEIFMDEAAERLDALGTALAALETGASGADAADHLAEAFRQAHTLKGGARAVARPEIEQISHALEILLDRLRSGAPAGPEVWAAVSAAVDALRALLAGRPADVERIVGSLTAVARENG